MSITSPAAMHVPISIGILKGKYSTSFLEIKSEYCRGEGKGGYIKEKGSSLRMVLHQLLQLQFLPLLVVLAAEPPVSPDATHEHTVFCHINLQQLLQY